MPPLRLISALLASAAIASPATAEPQTFEQAQALARAGAPSAQAAGLSLEAARASAHAAGALPDPRLTVGVENYPISGPMAGRFGADDMTMATVGVMQEFPNRARRRAQVAAAQADIRGAEARVAVEQLDARVGAATAWIDLYYAEQRLAAVEEILRNLEPLWEAAPSAVAAGSSRPAAGLAPQRARATLEDMRSELVAARGKAKAELARWTGDPSPTVAGPPPPASLSEAALREGLSRHPRLAGYASAAERAEAEVAMAEAEKRPDWALEASYGRRDPMFGDMVSAGVSVRLPLFASRRQDPVIAARRIDAARVVAERENARRALLAALEADLADHLMHHEQWVRARDVVLPAARHQSDLETASYAAGRAGLAEVVEAFADLADARLTALEREAAVVRDAVRINLTYGSGLQ